MPDPPDLDPTHRCETCGAEVTVYEGDETMFYVPVTPGANADAANMAGAITLALRIFGAPENEPDQKRAMAIGALRGALGAHEVRIAPRGDRA
jgi:hypothetical protein